MNPVRDKNLMISNEDKNNNQPLFDPTRPKANASVSNGMKYLSLIFFIAAISGAIIFWNERGVRTIDAVPREGEIVHRDPFQSLELTARAAYVFDTRTNQVLYKKNAELQFPLASLAKVMSVLIAQDIAPNSIVTITSSALAAEGDSGLLRDERWNISDLINFTLITSSNDGARALASVGSIGESLESQTDRSFIDLMNERARTLGMTQTFFLNPTGLDEGKEVSGAYGSAKDTATLFEYILRTHPEIFSGAVSERSEIASLDAHHIATNTNSIAARIPGLIASKTGFTDLAGGNLAIAFEAGPLHPIIVVVLGSTEKGRFADVEALVHAAIDTVATSE